MLIRDITADIRTISYGAPSYELRIEERVNGQWTIHWQTNEMSNDCAYSERNDRVAALRRAHEQRDARPEPYVHRPLPADYRPSGC